MQPAQAAVWTVIVVVTLELVQYGCGVPLVDDQKTVQQLAADGADEAFRCLDDLDVDRGEYGVEGGGELAVAVADEEPEASLSVVKVHEQFPRELGQPAVGWVRGDAEDVYAAGGVFDDEERVEPVQGDRVEVEQVASQDCVSLCTEELG